MRRFEAFAATITLAVASAAQHMQMCDTPPQ
jgi:hypothetical protein